MKFETGRWDDLQCHFQMNPDPSDENPARFRIARFQTALLRWYDDNRRDLPWRKTRDPYRIWVSEIMLQQTRVAAVLGHYRLFLKRFPNVRALAAASENSVLAAWSGLGYYRRARMMRECAQHIVAEHRCRFPRSSKSFRPYPESAATPPPPSPASLSPNQLQFWTATSNEYCSA